MAQQSFFFNSNSSDRIYSADDFAKFYAQLLSNGVFYTTADNLQTTPSSGMKVKVATGSAMINGYCYMNDANVELTLATASGSNPRIDRIVVRWSLTNRNILLATLTGTAAAQPAAPALTRSSTVYELGIADILVPAGSVTIPAGNITDTRTNGALCGLVNSMISAVYM